MEKHAKRRLWAKDLELEVDGTGDFGGGELTMTFLTPGPMILMMLASKQGRFHPQSSMYAVGKLK